MSRRTWIIIAIIAAILIIIWIWHRNRALPCPGAGCPQGLNVQGQIIGMDQPADSTDVQSSTPGSSQ